MFYTRWATLYGTLACRASGVGNARTKTADALTLNPGEAVVEMGYGTSANLPYPAGRVDPEGSVIIVNFSPGVLDVVRERTREFPQARLVRDDATRSPVARDLDASPAAAFATFVSGMFDDPAVMISSWTDLAGPGGRLCFVDLAETADSCWRLLNPVFRVLVRVAAPPEPRTMRVPPMKLLNRRFVATYRALESRCWAIHETTHMLGFAWVRAGVVE